MKINAVYLKAAFIMVALASLTMASVEYVYTDIDFNIASALAFTVTLPGESAVTSDPSGAATTGIEFNSSASGNDQYVNCSVKSAGSNSQDANTPCFNVSNTGTAGIQMNMSINATMPAGACDMNLSVANDDFQASPSWWYTLTTANQTLNSSLAVGNYNEYWLYVNFSGCGSSDSTQRSLFIWGYNATT